VVKEGDKMKKEYLELIKKRGGQKMKMNSKQKMQLEIVNDLLDRMMRLANETNKVSYNPSYEEERKILLIKRYADQALKNIEK